MKKKYVTTSISGIVTQIAKTTSIKGYTVGIIEAFVPTHDEMIQSAWTDNDVKKWINENNKRMRAICKFLNDNNL